MVTTEYGQQPTWRECDECDVAYFIGATMNPRNHKWRPIPLSLVPSPDVPGNFHIDWTQDFVEVFDELNVSIGTHPIVVYGAGNYRPHNPSHFTEHVHVEDGQDEWRPRERRGNFRLAMEDD